METNPLADAAGARHQTGNQLTSRPPHASQPDDDCHHPVCETQVYPIAMETRKKAETLDSSRAQSELADAAAEGYVFLDRQGRVIEINATALHMLGFSPVEMPSHPADVIGLRLGIFVAPAAWGIFSAFISEVFISHSEQVCDVALEQELLKRNSLWVRMTGKPSVSGQECHLTLVDMDE